MSTSHRRDFLMGMAAACATPIAARAQEQRPPNIIWIWCDNLAYADLGCYGGRVETPNIDALTKEGVRFTQYYVAHTVCSPSRAALLTGRQPFRCGIVDVLRPDGPSGLPADEITIAEVMRGRGYATAAYGKWHLGDRREYLPLQHGFDHWLGLPYSMDMLPTLLYNDNEIVDRLDGDHVGDVTERMIEDAIGFMDSHRDEPFFMYFSHTLPHPPINLPEKYENPDRSLYENALAYMDEQTGRIIDYVDANGLRDDTLIIFSSDNGPMLNDGNTVGMRGRIRDSYEGGIRVPLIARWPGEVPPNRTIDDPAIAYDVLPTLAEIAGAKLPNDRVCDGQSVAGALMGDGVIEREAPMFWVYFDNVTAMRDGDWKLHVAHRQRALDAPELYNVDADPNEEHSLTDEHPEIVDRMLKAIAEYSNQIPKVWSLQYPVRDEAKRPSGVRRE